MLIAATFAYIIWYLVYMVKDNDIALVETKKKIKVSRITRYVFPYIMGVSAVIAGVNFLWAFGLLTLYYIIVTQTFDWKKLLGYVDWKIISLGLQLLSYLQIQQDYILAKLKSLLVVQALI